MQTFVFQQDSALSGFEAEPGLSSQTLETLDRDTVTHK